MNIMRLERYMKDAGKKNRTLFSAFTIAFLDNFGLSIVFIMFAPLILNPEYGFFSESVSEGTKNILLGLSIGAFPILTFFGAPFWGDFADRFGRKKALLITILGTVLGHILSALAIYLESYAFLLIARGVAGFFAGNISICLATISDLSPNPKIKARNFGIQFVVMGIGWTLAMVLGGYLSDPTLFKFFSPVLPFCLAAILTFFGYLIVLKWFSETHVKKEGVHFDLIKSFHDIKAAIHLPEIRPYLFMLFLWYIGWLFTFQWFTAVSIEKFHLTQENASLYLIVLGILWVVGGLIINPFLVKRYSSFAIALGGTFCTALFIFLGSFFSNYLAFSFFFWLATLSAPASVSNYLNLVSSAASENMQGKAMGFTQSFQALAAVIVPLFGGILAKKEISLIFPAGGLFLILAFLYLLLKKPKGQTSHPS